MVVGEAGGAEVSGREVIATVISEVAISFVGCGVLLGKSVRVGISSAGELQETNKIATSNRPVGKNGLLIEVIKLSNLADI